MELLLSSTDLEGFRRPASVLRASAFSRILRSFAVRKGPRQPPWAFSSRGTCCATSPGSNQRRERERHGPHCMATTSYRRRYRERRRAVVHTVGAPREVVEDACQPAWTILLAEQPERYAVAPGCASSPSTRSTGSPRSIGATLDSNACGPSTVTGTTDRRAPHARAQVARAPRGAGRRPCSRSDRPPSPRRGRSGRASCPSPNR